MITLRELAQALEECSDEVTELMAGGHFDDAAYLLAVHVEAIRDFERAYDLD